MDKIKSDTPESDEVFGPSVFGVRSQTCRRLERERNEEMMFRGQWADKARKAEAALDHMEELNSELAATKKTLGTLIAWLQVDLGEENVKRLLDMMSPQMNVKSGGTAAQDS